MPTAHKPTEKTRTEVAALAGFGVKHDDIADYLGISDRTLTRYYRQELKTGSIRANAAIARTLFNAAKDGNVTACIFWLKTRAGWRETQNVELSGKVGVTTIAELMLEDYDASDANAEGP